MSAPLPSFSEIWSGRHFFGGEETPDPVQAEEHITAITGAETAQAEQQCASSRGINFLHNLGKIAANGDLSHLAQALRRAF